MKHRKLWALLTAAAALLVLAVFVSADTVDTADVITVTHAVRLRDGKIEQLDIEGSTSQRQHWRDHGQAVNALTESGKITYDAAAKEWVIKDLNLVVKAKTDKYGNTTRGCAFVIADNCPIVFEGENSITYDASECTGYGINAYVVFSDSIKVETTDGGTRNTYCPISFIGREANGKTPSLNLSLTAPENAQGGSKYAVYISGSVYSDVASNDITIDGLKFTASDTMYVRLQGGITIKNCPSVRIGGREVFADKDIVFENCPSVELECKRIFSFKNITIKNCPGFKMTPDGECDSVNPNSLLTALGSVTIDNCPGFVIENKLTGEDDEYNGNGGIWANEDITITNSEGFKIVVDNRNGAGVESTRGNVMIKSCRNFSIAASLESETEGVKCPGSVTIDDCEGFSIEAMAAAVSVSNQSVVPQLLQASEEESGDEDDKAIGITLKNSPSFRLEGGDYAISATILFDDINVTIDNCPGFSIKSSISSGIRVNALDSARATVDINNCPGFEIYSYKFTPPKTHSDGYGIYIKWDYWNFEKPEECSVNISNSDGFKLTGSGGIRTYVVFHYLTGVTENGGSVKIDNCKDFGIIAKIYNGVNTNSYNVNASTGYVLAEGLEDTHLTYGNSVAVVRDYNVDGALITHTGGTVADKEVYVEETTNDGDTMRFEAYVENAEEFEKTGEYAKKVVYTIPEPEPETKKSFRLPNLIEIRFETNGGEKLRSALSTPGYSLRLAKYVPEREGYTFTGWYSDKALTKKLERIVAFDDTTIYAGWTKNEG